LKEPDYKAISVNLIGALNTVKLAIHHMKKRPTGGAIVVTASKAGKT
jgi:NAD(P)-dependent dehydrogenase (short-subunit alcohol dehydrogenase family)